MRQPKINFFESPHPQHFQRTKYVIQHSHITILSMRLTIFQIIMKTHSSTRLSEQLPSPRFSKLIITKSLLSSPKRKQSKPKGLYRILIIGWKINKVSSKLPLKFTKKYSSVSSRTSKKTYQWLLHLNVLLIWLSLSLTTCQQCVVGFNIRLSQPYLCLVNVKEV